jgi:single stranded DNA-binding protein
MEVEMAFTLREVFVVGKVCGNIEQFSLPDGTPKLSFSVNTPFRRRSGEWQNVFHAIELYGDRAAAISSFLTKGHRVIVRGQLDYKKTTDDKGTERQGRAYVRAFDVQVQPKNDGEGMPSTPDAETDKTESHSSVKNEKIETEVKETAPSGDDEFEDDLPW